MVGKPSDDAIGLPLASSLREGMPSGDAIGMPSARAVPVRQQWRSRHSRKRRERRFPEGPTQKEKHSLCPWIVRTQFSSARPVRAPKAQQCFA